MVKGGIRAAAGGLRQSAETGNARAETIGPDGGRQTWKTGPGVAAGLADAKEYTQNLFRLKMVRPGKETGALLNTGADGGGPRDMGAAVGKPGAGALRATQPAPGTTAGEQAVKGASSTIAWHETSAENKNTRLDRVQNNGELSDMAQKYGTTLDTTLAIFPRLGYAIAYGANSNSQLGPVYTKNELKASTQSRQDKGELGNMAELHGTTLGTASASAVALIYSMGFNIPIHTPLLSVLGIIICNSDNKLLKMVPNTRYFIPLY
jgi:hypothetical protein